VGNLSTALRAVLQPAGSAVVDWLVQLSFPGNTLRLSLGGYSATGVGHYEAKLLSISPIAYQVSDRSGSIPALEMTIDVADKDGSVQAIIEGQYANEIRGSAATVYMVAKDPTINQSKWFTAFTGIVAKPTYPGRRVIRFTLRVDDLPFTRPCMQGWRITRAAWPNAKADDVGGVAPAVYGEHSAANHQTGPGMIGTLYVDTLAFRYVICAGRPKSIDRVYKDGIQLGSGYSFEYLTRGGRLWTVVKFTSDQGSGVITVDMHGYETVGDSSGSMITSKALQHAHFLTNFCFSEWKSGSWLSTSARIDASLTGAISTFLTARGAEGSLVVGAGRTPAAVIMALCDEESLYARWTNLGTVAFGVDGIFVDTYATETIDWYTDDQGDLPIDEADIDITSTISVQHVPSASQSTYLSSFSVDDLAAVEATPDTLDMTTSAAR
jgi:hypothetical protein